MTPPVHIIKPSFGWFTFVLGVEIINKTNNSACFFVYKMQIQFKHHANFIDGLYLTASITRHGTLLRFSFAAKKDERREREERGERREERGERREDQVTYSKCIRN